MKKTLRIIMVILLAAALVYTIMILNIRKNTDKFRDLILSHLDNGCFCLDDVTQFNWDEVYFLDPYENSKMIEQYINKKIFYFKPQFSEDGMQIMFFYKGIMVCYCHGNGFQNGYYMPWDEFEKFNGKRMEQDIEISVNRLISSKLGYVYLESTS